jgi:hypothetical protein
LSKGRREAALVFANLTGRDVAANCQEIFLARSALGKVRMDRHNLLPFD